MDGSSSAHQDSQSCRMATRAGTRLPQTPSRSRSSWPSRTTSCRTGDDSGGPWGTIALWNFSAPARDWRHWKNITPSAPRAMAW